jgi:phage-related protein (TIGR01555 family)
MDNVIRPDYFARTGVFDSFRNFLAGLGVVGRDKATDQRFVFDLLTPDQLEAAYRADWISRKVVDIPAFDACRAWRAWKADQDQIEKIEETERVFNLQFKLMQTMARARLYGGAGLVIGVKNQQWDEELNLEKVGKGDLAFVHMCTK